MRNLFSDAADSSHLKPFETGRLLFIFSLLVGLPRKGGKSHGWAGMLASAWGITLKTMDNQFKTYIRKGFSVERKKRSDAGSSVFNSEKKRRNTFTGLNTFKIRKYKEFRDNVGHLDEIALKNEYNNLHVDAKEAYEILEERDLMCGETLWDELKGHLLKS